MSALDSWLRHGATLPPWERYRQRVGLRPFDGRGRRLGTFGCLPGMNVRSPISFGCDKPACKAAHAASAGGGTTSMLDRHYQAMVTGDPNAMAAVQRLADKEKAGTATASEMAALWGLRALAENGGTLAPMTNGSAAMVPQSSPTTGDA